MEAEGVKTLQKSGTEEDIIFERSVDVRFVGQGSEINIPIARSSFMDVKREEVRRRFDETYKKLYGRTYPDSPVEFINFKVRASLPERLLQLPKIEKEAVSLQGAMKGQRQAYSGIAKDFIPYTVYDRYRLFPGAEFQGPGIIEERESTVVVGEDTSFSVDNFGFLWIDLRY
jgi:N-methylhydantoinase A/oxoprolinase/acetone carboxylase beta subunit